MNKEETLALWRQGRDAWNAWAKTMLDDRRAEMERDGTWSGSEAAWMKSAEVAFEDYTFSANAAFSGFVFPGRANFRKALFKGDSRFDCATLSGDVRFDCATFSGDARFDGATFSGNATFSNNANFARARLSGDNSLPPCAKAKGAEFSGDARFEGAEFRSYAKFDSAKFSRYATFESATFSGYAAFRAAQFEGEAAFYSATFSGYADFGAAKFIKCAGCKCAGCERAGCKPAGFARARFNGNTSFYKATFERLADFTAARGESAFTLERASFHEVPNFIQAHFEEAPRLDNVQVDRGRCGEDTSARYRALKRLAIDGHDHVREQEYFAGELKSLCGARFWFGLGYRLLSDFGRSILRPLLWWGLSVFGFAFGYLARHFARAAEMCLGYGNGAGAWLWASVADGLVGWIPSVAAVLPPPPAAAATACLAGPGTPWSAAVGLSIRKALPFAGITSSEKLSQIYACLYDIHGQTQTKRLADLPERFTPVIPDCVDYLSMFQIVLSIPLLFLFLLAVRRHFRIR